MPPGDSGDSLGFRHRNGEGRMSAVGPIELTSAERTLWEQISFPPYPPGSTHDAVRSSVEPAHDLARSLIDRKAIPDVRWRYFVDPDFSIGKHKSHRQIFEKNGTRGEAILRHPHFHKYLRFFVIGPDLPASTMASFEACIRGCHPVTSGDQEAFCQLARREVRTHSLDRKQAAEEFFKLSLELGLDVDMARAVRDAVMKMRSDRRSST